MHSTAPTRGRGGGESTKAGRRHRDAGILGILGAGADASGGTSRHERTRHPAAEDARGAAPAAALLALLALLTLLAFGFIALLATLSAPLLFDSLSHCFVGGFATLGERMGRQVCRPSFLPGKLLFLIRKAPANVTDNVGNSNHLWGVQCVDLMIMKKGYDLRRRSVTPLVRSSIKGMHLPRFFLSQEEKCDAPPRARGTCFRFKLQE